jgi:outer membrane protein OmpA-like peptidoglycan-associated protein
MKQRGNYVGLAFLGASLLFGSYDANAQKKEVEMSSRLYKMDVQPQRQRLPNIINELLDDEFAPTISPDGKSLIYQSNRKGKKFEGYYRLWESKKDSNGWWTEPKPLEAINAKATKGDIIGGPMYAYDGNTLYYFAKIAGSQAEDIYYSTKNGETWSEPMPVKGTVNTGDYEGFPSLSPDGQRLYFMRKSAGDATASTGAEGTDKKKEPKGKPSTYKLMVAKLQADGSWGGVEELPAPINQGGEKYPHIGPDGQTLYFSSLRGGGSPERTYDWNIYVSEMKEGGSWGEPKPMDQAPYVKNTGYTILEDGPMSIAPQGDDPHVLGFFSAHYGASHEIFTLPIPEGLRPRKTCFFKGIVVDSITRKPVEVTVQVENLTRPVKYSVKNDVAQGGRFGSVFTETNKYKVTVEHPDYKTYTYVADLSSFNMWTSCEKLILLQKKGVMAMISVIDAVTKETVESTLDVKNDNDKGTVKDFVKKDKGVFSMLLAAGTTYTAKANATDYDEKTQVIDLTSKMDGDTINRFVMIDKTVLVNFDNINFATARPRSMDKKELTAALLPRSIEVLNQVLKFMQDYPNHKVSIAAHTDDVGKDEYNQGLSERRAAAAKQYLVSKGIAEGRLSSQGFGESQPTVPNVVDGKPDKNNRALNRRVEFKAVK